MKFFGLAMTPPFLDIFSKIYNQNILFWNQQIWNIIFWIETFSKNWSRRSPLIATTMKILNTNTSLNEHLSFPSVDSLKAFKGWTLPLSLSGLHELLKRLSEEFLGKKFSWIHPLSVEFQMVTELQIPLTNDLTEMKRAAPEKVWDRRHHFFQEVSQL